MTTLSLDEAKKTLIQVEEAYRQIPTALRTGLPALFTALELASSLRPALDEVDRARKAQQAMIDGVQTAEAQRAAKEQSAYEKTRDSHAAELRALEAQVEALRRQATTLTDTVTGLEGRAAAAEATLEGVRQTVGAK